MSTNGYRFIGLGLYTVPEASRLSRVSVGRIRRWLRGYTFTTRTGPHKSPPVVTSELPPLDGGPRPGSGQRRPRYVVFVGNALA